MTEARTPAGSARYVAPVLGLIAGATFLLTALRAVSLDEVARSLRGGAWFPAAPLILLGVVGFIWAKARRWRTLLGDPPAIPTLSLVRPVAVGLLFNALIAHTGEFARAMTLQRRQGLPASGVLAGIAVERLFDFLIVLAFGLAAGAHTTVPVALAPALKAVALFSAGLGLGVVLALVRPDWLAGLVRAATGFWPARPREWLATQVAHALDALEPLRAAHRLPIVLAWSALQWGSIVWSIWFCAAVPGLTLTVAMAALTLIAIVVVFTLPNAPGYLGSTQVAFLAVLAPLGIGKDQAVAASLVYTLLVVLPMMLAGAAGLVWPARTTGR